MIQSTRLIQVVKQQLKRAGITYQMLGERIGLSESAVKQMFAAGNFSLKRLDEVCAALDTDIGEIVTQCMADRERIEMLAEDLEVELVKDVKLLLVAYCLVNNWSVEEILQRYDISNNEMVRLLARLDRMKLIELLPGNRVRLLITNGFRWQTNGPIEQFFRSQAQHEFFQGDFQSSDALQLVRNGDITTGGRQKLVERMGNIGDLFDDIIQQERRFAAADRQGTTMVLAIRQWEFSAFTRLERG